ncbi:Chorismate_bind domain-containing protein [Cephalotus follicularis]|uniref:Chorismate_bind domain-containing protein n=1 Tax=Cephalotus follicularis TaxID=3775 RepID=A0A1Q3BHE4_CEPFO|nr:Chorismate_bind domain-containing protein [Cephalotus follicularis]
MHRPEAVTITVTVTAATVTADASIACAMSSILVTDHNRSKKRHSKETKAMQLQKFSMLEVNKIENRPLAGTVRRGKTTEEDQKLEAQLLNDPKECAELVMLVDLGQNDVGKVTGELLDNLTCWDALRCIACWNC